MKPGVWFDRFDKNGFSTFLLLAGFGEERLDSVLKQGMIFCLIQVVISPCS